MRKQPTIVVFIALAFALSACAAGKQHRGINNARLTVEAAAIAADAADKTLDELYKDAPPEDTDSYCKNKIAAIIFAQVRITLTEALDVILLWEKSLTTYEMKKELGSETDLDWSNVLSSEAKWMDFAVTVIAVIDGVIKTLELWGIDLPPALDRVWDFLSGMTGRPVTEFEFTFDELQESVCYDYLPGGGS
jgi:hypothetical protein